MILLKDTFKIITAILLIMTVITGCDNKTEWTNEPNTLQDSVSNESALNENELYNEIFGNVSKV